MFQENKKAIEHALWQDLRKPDQECALIEVAGVIGNARIALDNLEKWTAPVKPEVQPSHSNWNPTVHQVPKGVVLVISYVHTFLAPYIMFSEPFQSLELSIHVDIQTICRCYRSGLRGGAETLRDHCPFRRSNS